MIRVKVCIRVRFRVRGTGRVRVMFRLGPVGVSVRVS